MRNVSLLLFSLFLLSISTSAQEKGYVLPGIATHVSGNAGVGPDGWRVSEGGIVPNDPEYNCDRLSTEEPPYSGTLGVNVMYSRDINDFKKYERAYSPAFFKNYWTEEQKGPGPLGTVSVGGLTISEEGAALVGYYVLEVGGDCVQTKNPTRKELVFHAHWVNGTTALDFEAARVSPGHAKKYLQDVIGKIKTLDYSSVKTGVYAPPEEAPE